MAEGTFLVANIRGFLRLTEEHGNQAAADLDTRFADVIHEGIDTHGGTVIMRRSGEVTVLFASTTEAVRAAVQLQAGFMEESRRSRLPPLQVGFGLAAGSYVEAAGSYVGSAIKLAERLCALAQSGQILVSDVVGSAGKRLSVHCSGSLQLGMTWSELYGLASGILAFVCLAALVLQLTGRLPSWFGVGAVADSVLLVLIIVFGLTHLVESIRRE